MASFALYC